MGRLILNRYSVTGLKKSLAAGASLGVMASAAFGQVSAPDAPLELKSDYLGYSAGVSARVGYSDNINLSSTDPDDEIFLSTMFTGGAIVSTPRVTAIALADLDFSYLTDQSDFRVNQNIGATSTFTAADNWLYFDLSGSSTRQIAGDNARFSGNVNAARNQRVDVHSYSASPYVFHRMANDSSVELRYRFSQVFIGDGANNISTFAGLPLDDTVTHEALASYESGKTFDRARIRLTAYGSETTENTSPFLVPLNGSIQQFSEFKYQQGSVLGEGSFALTPRFALSGAVGYDEVDPEDAAALFFSADELSGFFWRAGFTARPGPRSNVRIEYGDRYGDGYIDADLSYQVSSRFRMTAGAGRTFRTRAQSITSQFRSTQRQTLDFADRLREGGEQSARGLIDAANFASNNIGGQASQTSGIAVSDYVNAGLQGKFSRTDIGAFAFYSDDNFGFRQTETYGLRANLKRRMSRRLDGYANVAWRHADTSIDVSSCLATPGVFGLDVNNPLFDPAASCAALITENGDTDTIIGRIGAGYRVYENASAFVEYARTERLSSSSQLEYDENTLLLGITLDF